MVQFHSTCSKPPQPSPHHHYQNQHKNHHHHQLLEAQYAASTFEVINFQTSGDQSLSVVDDDDYNDDHDDGDGYDDEEGLWDDGN